MYLGLVTGFENQKLLILHVLDEGVVFPAIYFDYLLKIKNSGL